MRWVSRRPIANAPTGTLLLALVLLSCGALAAPLRAQSGEHSSSPNAVITGRDLTVIAGATVGAAALSLLDVPIARGLGDSAFHLRHPGFTSAAKRASLGVFAGQKVVTYSHDHPDNRIDRALLRPSIRATATFDARGLSFVLSPF